MLFNPKSQIQNPKLIMRIYDISQPLNEKIAVWPGDQKFRLKWTMRIQEGDSCNVSAVTMSVHTGTHLDAPFHFDEEGCDVGNVPLQCCMGPARVAEVPPCEKSISAAYLKSLDWRDVERVLFRTRKDGCSDQAFSRDYTCLSEDGAEYIAGRGLRLVGVDAPSVDLYSSKTLLCHKILNKKGVAILEGADLSGVPAGDYELICLPLKFSGLDGSPVRAVLRSLHE